MVDVVKRAYDEWRQHHRECAECGQHDWYNPGMPRLTKPGETPFTIVKTKDGKEVRISWLPDLDLLCTEGTLLFRAWVSSTVRNYIPIKAGE